VGQVGSDTGRVDNIVEGELVNKLTGLEEQRQWLRRVSTVRELRAEQNCLSNASSGTCNNGLDHLVELCRRVAVVWGRVARG
jgi:hypothetical protein